MSILVLGHGRAMDLMRCVSKTAPPFDLHSATCVDIAANLNPDVVVDLRGGHWDLPSDTFEMVIDAGGFASLDWYRQQEFWTELGRVVKAGAVFYASSCFKTLEPARVVKVGSAFYASSCLKPRETGRFVMTDETAKKLTAM